MKFNKQIGRAASAVVIAILASANGCSDATGIDPRAIASGSAPLAASPAPGLVAAFGFDEASGNSVIDASGTGNNGKLGRGTTRTASGRFGGALSFNGSSLVTIPNASSLQLTTAMTLEAWVRPTTVPNRWVDVIYKGKDNYYLMASTDRNMVPAAGGIFDGGPGTTKTYGAEPLPANTWTHLAATYDGATIRLYVNGTEVSAASRTGTLLKQNKPLTIGGDTFYGQYFSGLIDEVRVYNRALSPAELQADMNAPVNGDAQAPTVSITSPTSEPTYATTLGSVTISGTSSDNVGVTSVTWSTSGGATGTATGTTSWSADVPLQSGTNVVTVTARDAADNVGTATLTVTRSVPGLVAAYGFNETSGTSVTDASGFGSNGTLGSGVTRTASGRFGAGLEFSGSGAVTIPNAPSLQLTSGMTLEAWVRPTVVPNGWVDVIYKGNDNYYLMSSTDRNMAPAVGGIFDGGPGTTKTFGTTALPPNTWTHLAGTYDGSTIRLYVNGTLVSSVARTGSLLTQTNPLSIGGDAIYGQFFRGTIDEVRIYNRALTAAQIVSDMNTAVEAASPESATVSITSPTTSATYHTTAQTLSMSGTSSGAHIRRITWTNSRGGSGVAQGTTAWSIDGITLQTGTNDLTVVARDSIDSPLANATLSVTVDEPPPAPPTQLFIQTQPSATAQSGLPFAQQPIIQLRDASNNAVAKSGVAVTAAIASGGGTLGGTTVVSTNANGVATFTNLQITGTAGTRTLSFTAAGLTSATSTGIAISGPTGGLYPNRPATFTRSSEIDFTQPIPTGSDQIDQSIAGTSWNMIYFGNNWTQTTDATAPQSAPGIWRGRWAPGSYGGGVIGQGGGHGIGNVFTRAPSGTSRLYMSMRVYFDFDASLWHPISNKFVNLEGDHSQILMQLREGSNWRHAEELGYSGFGSFWVDNTATPGEAHIAGQVDNRAVPTRQWVQIEVLIDLPNRVFKIWQDGVLTTNATPNFASTEINTVGIYAYRGGGGETLSTDLFYRYDHFFIAW